MKEDLIVFMLANILGRSTAFILRHYVAVAAALISAIAIILLSWLYSFFLEPLFALGLGIVSALVLAALSVVWYFIEKEYETDSRWGDTK